MIILNTLFDAKYVLSALVCRSELCCFKMSNLFCIIENQTHDESLVLLTMQCIQKLKKHPVAIIFLKENYVDKL